jgi:hypothetical protein
MGAMGNSQSGWYRGHAPRCEDHAVLDTAKASPLDWGFWGAPSWQWQGRSYGAILRVDRTAGLTIASAGLTIEYSDCDAAGRSARTIDVERASIVEQPVGFGGVRRWLCCPACGNRTRVFYGGHRLRCRRCLGLRYRCQMLQGHDRAYRQAEKVARRCDPRAEWGDAFPDKPKWMRWRTYRQLAEQHDWLQLIGLTSGSASHMLTCDASQARAAYAGWRAKQRRGGT